ncbi:hypothetical protein SDC9_211785 [bioreactor metagenome]|uniref:Uncharacterized protein n=1 Tax=bioreactor metagenome TaxID=1076179 RepID=A0A645JKR2_9ZZZZ
MLEPALEPGKLAHPGDSRYGAGNEHDEDHVLQVIHPCESRRFRVLSHDPDFIPPPGKLQDNPEKKGENNRKDESPVNAGAPEDRQPG